MNPHQNKILSTILIATVIFLGLQTLSVLIALNQTTIFAKISIILFAFIVFCVSFIFDLHLKRSAVASFTSAKFRHLMWQALRQRFHHFFDWKFLKHYLNYLVLPSILFWAIVILVYLNPFAGNLKQILILASTFSFVLYFWHMKEHITSNMEAHEKMLRLLATTKLLAVYAAFAATIGISWYYGLNSGVVFISSAAVSFLLVRQALISYSLGNPDTNFLTFIFSILIGFAAIWVYKNWTYQYFTAALLLAILYNTFWGLLHHKLDRTLNKKIVWEYILLDILVLAIIFSTHNFGPRIS